MHDSFIVAGELYKRFLPVPHSLRENNETVLTNATKHQRCGMVLAYKQRWETDNRVVINKWQPFQRLIRQY